MQIKNPKNRLLAKVADFFVYILFYNNHNRINTITLHCPADNPIYLPSKRFSLLFPITYPPKLK